MLLVFKGLINDTDDKVSVTKYVQIISVSEIKRSFAKFSLFIALRY